MSSPIARRLVGCQGFSLELLSNDARADPGMPDILMVHGICSGAWIYEKFLARFAATGVAAHALSLRGHGASEGRARLRSFTLADYRADLAAAVRALDRPLVLLGHSLGGAVVQDYLRAGGCARAAILMASVPPYGIGPATWRMLTSAPALYAELCKLLAGGVAIADERVVREALFSPQLEAREVARFMRRTQDEAPVVALELQGLRPLAPLPWLAPPMMVLGAHDDRFIPVSDVRATALYYGVRPHVLGGIAHVMMWDRAWHRAADAVLGWLRQRRDA